MQVDGFTLVEIMIVVVIIGLLAALAIPAFQRLRMRSQATRYATDFRQFESAFQRFALETGDWPPAAINGVTPTGMSGYLPVAYATGGALGGLYGWSGPSQNIIVRSGRETDAVMQQVDQILDDGDLTTGDFTSLSGGGYGLRVR